MILIFNEGMESEETLTVTSISESITSNVMTAVINLVVTENTNYPNLSTFNGYTFSTINAYNS